MMFGRQKRGPHPGLIKNLSDRVASEKREPVLEYGPGTPHKSVPVKNADGLVRITYEMMKKGSHVTRRGVETRQILVMAGNSVKLVNSGDLVDRETYEALVNMAVIDPIPGMDVPDSSPDTIAGAD
jgi:hypothetical protein